MQFTKNLLIGLFYGQQVGFFLLKSPPNLLTVSIHG